MSLYQLTVTTTDISQLQQGILFTTTSAGDISAQVAAINANAPAPASQTVTSYANQLLAQGLSSSQVMMGVSALMTGATQTVATLTNFVTNPGLIPSFASFAVTNKLDVTQVVGEDIGLAFAGNASFVANFGSQSTATFASTMLGLTGISQAFTISQVQFFINLYQSFGLPGNPTPTAAQIQAAANGVVFGLDVALNLEGTGGTQATTNQTLVKNALFDLAQTASSPPGSAYVPGAALSAQPIPFPFQGSGAATTFNLTVTQDTVALTQSNSVVNGTFGGAGATWTPGDTITAASGTTGQTFNITGNGPIGNINVTSMATNKVSGVQTANVFANTALGALNTESVTGDFSATGPMGAWTGLTQLNVNSGSSILGGTDNLTALVTTAVLVTDTAVAVGAGQTMTVNGSLSTTIGETNVGPNGGSIAVNGGNGTTSASITQTETGVGGDAFVKVTDFNGASAAAAGTITNVVLNGLSHLAAPGTTITGPVNSTGFTITGLLANQIIDSALTSLSVSNADTGGVGVSITNSLTTQTATTLALSLSHDSVDGTGFSPGGGLATTTFLQDAKNEFSTIHLTLGSQNSAVQLVDNGLTTLDTPTAGTGALVGSATGTYFSSITDKVAAAVSIDLSGLNGANNVDIFRGPGTNTDVFTLGNFGTNNGQFGGNAFATSQHENIFNTNPQNVDTINFGSGAYTIGDAPHVNLLPTQFHTYVNTAANGAGVANFVAPGFPAQWAIIQSNGGGSVVTTFDHLIFKGDNVQTFTAPVAEGPGTAGVQAGITAALTTTGPHTAFLFTSGGNTYVYDHAGTGLGVSPGDAMVELVGLHAVASIDATTHALIFAV